VALFSMISREEEEKRLSRYIHTLLIERERERGRKL
jgi:hypothetical protein